MESGFFQMRTAKDLFAKLEWELENLRQDPSNPWHAFNFFVTAEHLPDWINKKHLKGKMAELRICSHLANAGKHYTSDKDSVESAFRDGVFEEDVFEKGVFEEWLTIRLPPKEELKIGNPEIDAVSLAEKIVDWWKNYLRQKNIL